MALEVGLNTETIAGGGIAGGAFLMYVRKFYLDWIGSRPQVASAAAVESQFKALREQIESLQADNKELRKEFNRMDVVIHRQQTKLTRTEMLVRQFVGMAKEWGKEVPKFMQDELDDLLHSDPKPEANING